MRPLWQPEQYMSTTFTVLGWAFAVKLLAKKAARIANDAATRAAFFPVMTSSSGGNDTAYTEFDLHGNVLSMQSFCHRCFPDVRSFERLVVRLPVFS
jgi:hypothetical protein